MLCMHCGHNQATKSKEVVEGGKKVSKFYCAECFRTLFQPEEEKVQKCPYCGKSKDAVLKSGLVGCANCYTTFSKQLLPIVQKTQDSVLHTGETPKEADREVRLKIRLRELQVLMDKRMEEENVEKVKEYSKESRRISALMGGK